MAESQSKKLVLERGAERLHQYIKYQTRHYSSQVIV
jgi:hypothetical protein